MAGAAGDELPRHRGRCRRAWSSRHPRQSGRVPVRVPVTVTCESGRPATSAAPIAVLVGILAVVPRRHLGLHRRPRRGLRQQPQPPDGRGRRRPRGAPVADAGARHLQRRAARTLPRSQRRRRDQSPRELPGRHAGPRRPARCVRPAAQRRSVELGNSGVEHQPVRRRLRCREHGSTSAAPRPPSTWRPAPCERATARHLLGAVPTVPASFVQIYYPAADTSRRLPEPRPRATGGPSTAQATRRGSTQHQAADPRRLPKRVIDRPGQADADTPDARPPPSRRVPRRRSSVHELPGSRLQATSTGARDAWSTSSTRRRPASSRCSACSPSAATEHRPTGSGTNAVFPVYKLVGAVVCGYHFSATETVPLHHAASAPATRTSSDADPDRQQRGQLHRAQVPARSRISGSNAESECALGDLRRRPASHAPDAVT